MVTPMTTTTAKSDWQWKVLQQQLVNDRWVDALKEQGFVHGFFHDVQAGDLFVMHPGSDAQIDFDWQVRYADKVRMAGTHRLDLTSVWYYVTDGDDPGPNPWWGTDDTKAER